MYISSCPSFMKDVETEFCPIFHNKRVVFALKLLMSGVCSELTVIFTAKFSATVLPIFCHSFLIFAHLISFPEEYNNFFFPCFFFKLNNLKLNAKRYV